MTTREAAQILGVGKRRILQFGDAGILPTVAEVTKLGARLFRLEDVQALARARKVKRREQARQG